MRSHTQVPHGNPKLYTIQGAFQGLGDEIVTARQLHRGVLLSNEQVQTVDMWQLGQAPSEKFFWDKLVKCYFIYIIPLNAVIEVMARLLVERGFSLEREAKERRMASVEP